MAAVFLLSVLQVLFAAEGELLPHDPAWTFDFLTEQELADSACAPSYTKFLRQWKREYVYELMRLGLEVTPYRTLEHIAGCPPYRRHRRPRPAPGRHAGGRGAGVRRRRRTRYRQVRLPPR